MSENSTKNDSTNSTFRFATFAGGCFWCMIPPFEGLDGVIDVKSGYTGGHIQNPTYEKVCMGKTGHYEAIQVTYDPSKISYRVLLDIFWKQINPTDPGGQFFDRGPQYKTAVFYHDQEQKGLAEESKAALEHSGRFSEPIATEILPACAFFPAEEYHQDYHRKNPEHYKGYRTGSGREAYIERTWNEISGEVAPRPGRNENSGEAASDLGGNGNSRETVPGAGKTYHKPDDAQVRQKLTPVQFRVTQENGTEPPFNNEYWDNKRQGIYVDIVSGEPLFSSLDKFDSGCGWPSFVKPVEKGNIKERLDRSHNMLRTEVRSRHGDSHLGHVFTDGPAPTGLRYCINSAALKFIPVEDLEKEGYGEYRKLFDKN